MSEAAAEESGWLEKSPKGNYVKYDSLVGRGSFKKVFKAQDLEHGNLLAWNEVSIKNYDSKARKRIMNEVKLLRTLKHDHLIRFYGAWLNQDKTVVVFITELMHSGTLKDFVNQYPVTRKQIKVYCRDILSCLDYLHTPNGGKPSIIHRDIKSENIFISRNSIKIGDLGLATAMSDGLSTMGTPEFMAPDMFDNQYDCTVDIWSFGMCLLEMVLGRPPYSECTTFGEMLRKVSNGFPPEALRVLRWVWPEAADFVTLCLGHPQARPEPSSTDAAAGGGGGRGDASAGEQRRSPSASESSAQTSPVAKNEAAPEDGTDPDRDRVDDGEGEAAASPRAAVSANRYADDRFGASEAEAAFRIAQQERRAAKWIRPSAAELLEHPFLQEGMEPASDGWITTHDMREAEKVAVEALAKSGDGENTDGEDDEAAAAAAAEVLRQAEAADEGGSEGGTDTGGATPAPLIPDADEDDGGQYGEWETDNEEGGAEKKDLPDGQDKAHGSEEDEGSASPSANDGPTVARSDRVKDGASLPVTQLSPVPERRSDGAMEDDQFPIRGMHSGRSAHGGSDMVGSPSTMASGQAHTVAIMPTDRDRGLSATETPTMHPDFAGDLEAIPSRDLDSDAVSRTTGDLAGMDSVGGSNGSRARRSMGFSGQRGTLQSRDSFPHDSVNFATRTSPTEESQSMTDFGRRPRRAPRPVRPPVAGSGASGTSGVDQVDGGDDDDDGNGPLGDTNSLGSGSSRSASEGNPPSVSQGSLQGGRSLSSDTGMSSSQQDGANDSFGMHSDVAPSGDRDDGAGGQVSGREEGYPEGPGGTSDERWADTVAAGQEPSGTDGQQAGTGSRADSPHVPAGDHRGSGEAASSSSRRPDGPVGEQGADLQGTTGSTVHLHGTETQGEADGKGNIPRRHYDATVPARQHATISPPAVPLAASPGATGGRVAGHRGRQPSEDESGRNVWVEDADGGEGAGVQVWVGQSPEGEQGGDGATAEGDSRQPVGWTDSAPRMIRSSTDGSMLTTGDPRVTVTTGPSAEEDKTMMLMGRVMEMQEQVGQMVRNMESLMDHVRALDRQQQHLAVRLEQSLDAKADQSERASTLRNDGSVKRPAVSHRVPASRSSQVELAKFSHRPGQQSPEYREQNELRPADKPTASPPADPSIGPNVATRPARSPTRPWVRIEGGGPSGDAQPPMRQQQPHLSQESPQQADSDSERGRDESSGSAVAARQGASADRRRSPSPPPTVSPDFGLGLVERVVDQELQDAENEAFADVQQLVSSYGKSLGPEGWKGQPLPTRQFLSASRETVHNDILHELRQEQRNLKALCQEAKKASDGLIQKQMREDREYSRQLRQIDESRQQLRRQEEEAFAPQAPEGSSGAPGGPRGQKSRQRAEGRFRQKEELLNVRETETEKRYQDKLHQWDSDYAMWERSLADRQRKCREDRRRAVATHLDRFASELQGLVARVKSGDTAPWTGSNSAAAPEPGTTSANGVASGGRVRRSRASAAPGRVAGPRPSPPALPAKKTASRASASPGATGTAGGSGRSSSQRAALAPPPSAPSKARRNAAAAAAAAAGGGATNGEARAGVPPAASPTNSAEGSESGGNDAVR